MKEDRQSSFPHIRRGFPQERKKNLPFERKSFSITTDQSCTRAGKNSIQSIFRNKPWKHTARCFIGAAIPTSTLRLTSVAFITCSRKAATLASSNENHGRNSLLTRLRCELYSNAIWPLPMLHLDYRQISRQSYLFNISFDYKNNPSPFLPLPSTRAHIHGERTRKIYMDLK